MPMTSELITDWSTHDQAFSEILNRATRTIDIFDQDLTRLPLERPDHSESLGRLRAPRPHATRRTT